MSDNLPLATVATLEVYANNLKAKLEMAGIFLRSGLTPAHFKTAEAVLTAILYGQELGFSPMQSLQSIQVIQGKPTVDAAGLQALALQHGGRIESLEHTDKICKIRVMRGKEPTEAEFTMHEAELMGLASKDNWRKMPKDMLWARAVSRGVRRAFADKVRGFYSREEMQDSTPFKNEDPQPIDVTPKQAAPVENPKLIATRQAMKDGVAYQYDGRKFGLRFENDKKTKRDIWAKAMSQGALVEADFIWCAEFITELSEFALNDPSLPPEGGANE